MSNINYIEIDEDFPKLGINNSSQGFRDNFATIKNSLAAAKGEIENLELNTARLDESNNFNRNNIVNANFVNCTDELFVGGTVNSTTLVQFNNGPYQTYVVDQSLQFTLDGFPPSGKVGKLTIQLFGTGVSKVVTFALSGNTTIKKSANVPATISVSSPTNPIIIEFWTYDGGTTVFMNYLGAFV